jgi:hypothetical protein
MHYQARTFVPLVCLILLAFPILGRALSVEITATVPGCGDTTIGPGEQCEGANLGGATCASLGYARGTLRCAANCMFDRSQCGMQVSSGGGGYLGSFMGTVAFFGDAYANSPVVLLKDGQIVSTVAANAQGAFQATVTDLAPGDYMFTAYAVDTRGVQSPLLGFPVSAQRGGISKVTGIALPPSINVIQDPNTKKNELQLSGDAKPGAMVYAIIDGGNGFSLDTQVDTAGKYLAVLNASLLVSGNHTIRVYTVYGDAYSALSRTVGTLIGSEGGGCTRWDLNCDGRVNLVDLSMLLYWCKNPIFPERMDLNSDGRVSIVDFSILFYHWTG